MSSIADPRYSQRLSAQGNPLFDNVPSYKWETASEKLSYILYQYKSGTFDFNPPHQRNEALHSIKWESDIVNSVIRGLPLGFPEFDTVLTTTGACIRRSLDGKQRCTAILRYMEDKFKYSLPEPASMKGKKFSELTQRQQNAINNRIFNYTYTETQLPHDVVSEWFCKKQVMQKTTQGERLNSLSNSSELVKFIHAYNNANDIGELFTSNKRYKDLETTARIIYCLYAYTQGKKLDPKFDTIMNYAKTKKEPLSERLKKRFTTYLDGFYELLSHCDTIQKYSKSFMLPLLNIFLLINESKTEVVNKLTLLDMFITKNINKLDKDGNLIKFYEDVGGNHDATKNRCAFIIEEYNKFIESNK